VINNSSGRGGDKNPPLGKIESSHKLPLRKKSIALKVTSTTSPSKIWSLRMTSRIFFLNIDHPGGTVHQNPSLEIVDNETFNEEESFLFQRVIFDNESKKLIIEKSDVKNKKWKSRLEVNLRKMRRSNISRIHRETNDALDDSIGGLEEENTNLKERIQ
jgi:hypothetical protein